MFIDPFRLCVAVVPLVVYGAVLGLVNCAARPRVTTGARDLAALAVGLGGLIIVGPLELFMPIAAATYFGPYVWLFLLALYGLIVTFLVLWSGPRLVIYNVTSDELRPVLAEVVPGLDPDAQWAGNSLVLPRLAVQLHVDSFPAMRQVSLVASGHQQDLAGWRRLEAALTAALRGIRVRRNPHGSVLIGLAVLLLGGCLYYVLAQPHALAEGCYDMLRY